jgi:hypothetical protein
VWITARWGVLPCIAQARITYEHHLRGFGQDGCITCF